ncbi:MAG: 2-C-methyl-D-erythritol 4-phosphate cytidylyltransferase [Candidatus Caldatribacteriota bacterium]
MKIVALIPAAGLGRRMNNKISKPFILISGKPLIAYTLETFEKCSLIQQICLVINSEEKEKFIRDIVVKYNLHKVEKLIKGGDTRQASVYNGLNSLEKDTDLVVIHDGARPLIKEDLIRASIEVASQYGSAILALPSKDTIKLISNDLLVEETLCRERIWRAQTPQTFRYDIVFSAYQRAIKEGINATDDAAIVERCGYKVKLVMGSEENIKITTPFDILLAQNLLKTRF